MSWAHLVLTKIKTSPEVTHILSSLCMIQSAGLDVSVTHLKSGWLCSSSASPPSELPQSLLRGQEMQGLGLNLPLPTKPQQSELIRQPAEHVCYMQRK